MNNKVRLLAFYLPQFHPTKDNDKWWGKGFTEWTNVGKAKPLFWGHNQPRVPSDLGYYDLRLSSVREEQALLAKEAGIEGFCYYHYWFGNGEQQLELPFNDVLASGKPDFPFCLCWANESWHEKFWKNSKSRSIRVLKEQKYPGIDDDIQHFYKLLPAFQDKRYIKVNDKPLFMIYRPFDLPDANSFINLWNELAIKNGLTGIYFSCQTNKPNQINKLRNVGFDNININRLSNTLGANSFVKTFRLTYNRIFNIPIIISYKKIIKYLTGEIEKELDISPIIIPGWDHTPRSGRAGYVLVGENSKLFEKHVRTAFDCVKNKPYDNRLVFLKSWNEWGEGNYIEPDLKHGKSFIEGLKKIISDF